MQHEPPPAGLGPAPAEQSESAEGYADRSTQIVAEQGPGQRVVVRGSGLLALPPEAVFDLLTHPANEQVFRHLHRCTERRVLADDGAGRVALESVHVATWRLLFLSGRVTTPLRVEQDRGSGDVAFSLLPAGRGLLRRFDGAWRVAPAPAAHCAHLRGGAPDGPCSRLELRQEVEPALSFLPPVGRLLKNIACAQLRGVYEDLAAEAARIGDGRPTLPPRD